MRPNGWYCGTLALFTDDLTLREPTVEEVDELLADGQVRAILGQLWDTRLARVAEHVNGVEFKCGCHTSASGGLFALEGCAETCPVVRTIVKMGDDSGKTLVVIR